MDLSPDLRANVDYVFVLRENVIQNRERLYKAFFGVFPTFDMFCQVMNACTENYECLVLNNSVRSNKLEDCVFWYKATDHPPFKLGAPEFWQYHSQNYGENDDEQEDDDEDFGYAKHDGSFGGDDSEEEDGEEELEIDADSIDENINDESSEELNNNDIKILKLNISNTEPSYSANLELAEADN